MGGTMARAGDPPALAAQYDSGREANKKVDMHIAECVILREHIKEQLREIKVMIGTTLTMVLGGLAGMVWWFLSERLQ